MPVNDTLPASGHLGRIIGKFRLDRRLGSGAMGDVFLGIHVSLGNFVAVKILNATATAQATGVERFLNEARAVAAIGHENIAAVIDQDHLDDGTPYIVMEYVEGATLRDLLHERALPLRTSAQLAIDALAAVGAAHAKGIVHRDLKPENIRVMPSGRAKVLDFGVAKLLSSPSPQLSTDGALIGTPHYMAPEQVAAGPIDGRADVYAIGVVLFECVTGRRPFDGVNLVELLQRQLHAAPPWPHQLRADVPPALEEIILKALEKDRERRFESADAMSEALRALLPSLSTGDAPPLSSPRPDQTQTPGAVYTPTRKERPAVAPSIVGESETDTSRGPSRLGLLIAVFVVIAGVSAGAVVLVQMQRQDSVTIVPMPADLAPKKVVVPAPVTQGEPEPVKVAEVPVPVVPVKVSAPAAKKAKPVIVATREAKHEPEPQPAAVGELHVVSVNPEAKIQNLPPDYDPKHFDPIGYLPRAQALARARMSDAVLINLDSEGVYPDGHADLTLSREYEAEYWYRSPSRSVVNPALPVRDQEIACKVYVTVTAKGIETHLASSSDGCTEKFLPPRKCTLAEAMKRGLEQGARADKVAKVSYLSDGTWMVDQGDGRNETQYVSCP